MRVEPAVRQHHRQRRQQHPRGQHQDAAEEAAHVQSSLVLLGPSGAPQLGEPERQREDREGEAHEAAQAEARAQADPPPGRCVVQAEVGVQGQGQHDGLQGVGEGPAPQEERGPAGGEERGGRPRVHSAFVLLLLMLLLLLARPSRPPGDGLLGLVRVVSMPPQELEDAPVCGKGGYGWAKWGQQLISTRVTVQMLLRAHLAQS